MKSNLSCLAILLISSLFIFGCGDSHRRSQTVPIPEPMAFNSLENYGMATSPVTSSAGPNQVWMSNFILKGTSQHPSIHFTASILRPGSLNTPAERILEEVVLTRPDSDSRISPYTVGPPPGWTIVFMFDRITLSRKEVITQDQNGNTVVATQIDKQANGLTDFNRKVIWVFSTDDAVTPEGSPLAPAYSHELLHAHLYEEAIKRGLSHNAAAREAKSID